MSLFQARRSFVFAALALLLFYGYALFLSPSAALVALRLKAVDLLYQDRHRSAARPDPGSLPLVIAAVDEESLKILGERWPWSRKTFADFLKRAATLGAGPVGFDLSFAVPSGNPADDAELADAVRAKGNVLLSSYFAEKGRHVQPLAALAGAAAGTGFLNVPRDADLVNRRHEPYHAVSAGQVPSFSLVVASQYMGTEPKKLYERHYRARSGSRWTAYDYRTSNLRVIPFWKFVKDRVGEEDVRGKMILVGATGEIFHDTYATPLGILPGVVLHANQILNYIYDKRLQELSPALLHTVLAALILFLTPLFARLKPLVTALLFALLAAVTYGIASAFFKEGCVIDLFSAWAALAISFAAGLAQRSIQINQGLKYQTTRDGLTDLFTYRYMESRLMSEYDRAKKEGTPLSFVIFDLDHFKRLNDACGHEKGNDILIAFARILKANTRGDDIVARYGGEEFCMLLPHRQSDEAAAIAERIRASLEATPFRFARKGESALSEVRATVSAGICSSNMPAAFNGKELLRLADHALLTAKETGRNRICIYGSSN